jgi:hypothetical protein
MVGGQVEVGMIKPASFNRFSHASRLAGPEDRFVSINNDIIYSIAQVDVSGSPVLLRVPDTAGRYYVLPGGGRGYPGPGGRPRRAGFLRAAADLDAGLPA